MMNEGFDNSIVRNLNNSIILRHLLENNSLSKADITKLSNLTPRSVQLIVNRLLADDLVLEMPIQRGKVGQPSTPICLNKKGAYAIGIKVGRRRLTVQVSNLGLEIESRYDKTYHAYNQDKVVQYAKNLFVTVKDILPHDKIKGIACAVPSDMIGFVDQLSDEISQPITSLLDIHAAALAEQWLQQRLQQQKWSNYSYFFIGTYITGAIFINDLIYKGTANKESQFAKFNLDNNKTLCDACSLIHLDNILKNMGEKGVLADGLTGSENLDYSNFSPLTKDIITQWIEEAATALAYVINQTQYIMNLQGIIIETALPKILRHHICQKIQSKVTDINIIEGNIGASARSYGASIQPLLSYFQVKEILNTIQH